MFKFYVDGMEGKKNGNEEKREKINEVPGADKMSDVERFTKQKKPTDRKEKEGQKDEGILPRF
jgi:hypothetical protein